MRVANPSRHLVLPPGPGILCAAVASASRSRSSLDTKRLRIARRLALRSRRIQRLTFPMTRAWSVAFSSSRARSPSATSNSRTGPRARVTRRSRRRCFWAEPADSVPSRIVRASRSLRVVTRARCTAPTSPSSALGKLAVRTRRCRRNGRSGAAPGFMIGWQKGSRKTGFSGRPRRRIPRCVTAYLPSIGTQSRLWQLPIGSRRHSFGSLVATVVECESPRSTSGPIPST